MRMTPAVKVILIINVVFYLLTYLITPAVALDGHTDWFMNFNALHPIGYSGFALYQYVTYMSPICSCMAAGGICSSICGR